MTGSGLTQRLDALREAADLAEGRVSPELSRDVRSVLDRAGDRLRLSPEHTVVALAGATGSGKSSLFNALAGLELSVVSARRPTTAGPMACVWGPDTAGSLLDALEVPDRQRVVRDSVLDARHDEHLSGLVVLDLPDHDSTVDGHRLEVDRLVRLVDLLVWVVDPQKYADAALHERYLRRLGGRETVMTVVLNQVDVLPDDQRDTCLDDLGRLLSEDGLHGVRTLGVSAREGTGLEDLRDLLAEHVAHRRAAADRIGADLGDATARLDAEVGPAQPDEAGGEHADLVIALAAAGGVPVVAESVEDVRSDQGASMTCWPPTMWLRGSPDPRRRAAPEVPRVQRAQVHTAVRAAVDSAVEGLPDAWAHVVRGRVEDRADKLADELDASLPAADLGLGEVPRRWKVARVVHPLLLLVVLAGVAGGVALGVAAALGLDLPASAASWPVVPAALVVVGLGGGLLLHVRGRTWVRSEARRCREAAERALVDAVRAAARTTLVDALEEERAHHARARAAVQRVRAG